MSASWPADITFCWYQREYRGLISTETLAVNTAAKSHAVGSLMWMPGQRFLASIQQMLSPPNAAAKCSHTAGTPVIMHGQIFLLVPNVQQILLPSLTAARGHMLWVLLCKWVVDVSGKHPMATVGRAGPGSAF